MSEETKNLPALVTIQVGSHHIVGEFFWTSEETCIGFSKDAHHGHGLSFGGSIDAGDVVEVLGIEGIYAVVKALKKRVPYGAPCPSGMIFMMPVSQILSWPDKVKKDNDKQLFRDCMARKYACA